MIPAVLESDTVVVDLVFVKNCSRFLFERFQQLFVRTGYFIRTVVCYQFSLVCKDIVGDIFVCEGLFQIAGKLFDVQKQDIGITDPLCFRIFQNTAAGHAVAAFITAGD